MHNEVLKQLVEELNAQAGDKESREWLKAKAALLTNIVKADIDEQKLELDKKRLAVEVAEKAYSYNVAPKKFLELTDGKEQG